MKQFIYFILLISCSLGAETVTVRLIEEVHVEAPFIELGEIAYIETSDQKIKEKLVQMRIAAAPKVGRKKSVHPYHLRSLLTGMGEVQVLGESCLVRTKSREISADEMKELILSEVQHQLDQESELELDYRRLPESWRVADVDTLTIRAQVSNPRLIGPSTVTLRAYIEDQVQSSVNARIYINQYREMPVLNRPLQKGEKITASDIDFERKALTRSTGMQIAQPKHVAGMVAKTDLKAGEIVNIRDFSPPVLIQRGSFNKIIVVNGNIKMAITGARALQNGRKGETIQFANPMNTRQNLFAKVIEPGLAVIKIH